MIYLAMLDGKPIHRLQTYKTNNGWVVSDRTGRMVIISNFNNSYEELLNNLVCHYGNLLVSSEVTDLKGKHIVCINNQYCVLNEFGDKLFIPELQDYHSQNRLKFGVNGTIEVVEPSSSESIPDYYEDAKPVLENNTIWIAKDIDTKLWVCFNILCPEKIISMNRKKHIAISEGLNLIYK